MPLEQHPVPQHISSYQFRLVGEMTLRQFSFLAGGCVLGLLFYAAPLLPIIKWPLIILFVFTGFALAFMPLQERPLDKWIVAFLKAVFSPTQFIWQKKPQTPDIFKATPRRAPVSKAPVPPPSRKKLTQYLETLPSEPKSPLELEEEKFVKKTIGMFQSAKEPRPPLFVAQPTQPVSPPKPTSQFPPEITRFYKEKASPKKAKLAPPKTKVILPEKPTRPQTKKTKVEAKFGPGLPFPEKPSQPNTLVGMVLDPDRKIIEGAIIEIRDSKGVPVRALKTNKLGQFRSVTPLDNDQYEIETEKEDYQFDIFKIELAGKVVDPIEIRAKGRTNEPAQNA